MENSIARMRPELVCEWSERVSISDTLSHMIRIQFFFVFLFV